MAASLNNLMCVSFSSGVRYWSTGLSNEMEGVLFFSKISYCTSGTKLEQSSDVSSPWFKDLISFLYLWVLSAASIGDVKWGDPIFLCGLIFSLLLNCVIVSSSYLYTTPASTVVPKLFCTFKLRVSSFLDIIYCLVVSHSPMSLCQYMHS